MVALPRNRTIGHRTMTSLPYPCERSRRERGLARRLRRSACRGTGAAIRDGMKTNAVTVTISTYNTAADTWTHRAEIWTRGDLGPGGLHTVITPAGDVCTVSHS